MTTTLTLPAAPAAARPAGAGEPIRWDRFDPDRLDPAVIAVVRATCLLESRSASYGAYLTRVLPDRFADRVDAWAAEEHQHGRALRRWLALADPAFDADGALDRLLAVPYHDDTAGDRGGPTQELMARCAVEALASGFYLALADRVDEPLLRQICLRLSADERRHFDRFLQWTDTTSPLSPARRALAILRRLAELEDDQISTAAIIARGTDGTSPALGRRRHFAEVYAMYGRRHIAVVQAMIWDAVGAHPPAGVQRALTTVGTTLVRGRAAMLCFGGDRRSIERQVSTKPASPASTVTFDPSATVPSRMAIASRSPSSRWMSRLSGRAPNMGS